MMQNPPTADQIAFRENVKANIVATVIVGALAFGLYELYRINLYEPRLGLKKK